MIHSVDHFLTTHVGSLPRPEELIQIMYSKEEGKPVDQLLLAAQVRAAVAAVVAKQRKSGIAIVSDGEMSKPSYATYIKDRLAGFAGTGNTFVYQDLSQSGEARVQRSRPVAAQDPCMQRTDYCR